MPLETTVAYEAIFLFLLWGQPGAAKTNQLSPAQLVSLLRSQPIFSEEQRFGLLGQLSEPVAWLGPGPVRLV